MRLFVHNRHCIAVVFAAALMVSNDPADARMYQWTSPSTGNVQMAGDPPSWYRSDGDGPRVLVFDGGYLVDDTNIDVSSSRKRVLRKDAFDELNRRRTLDAIKRIAKGRGTAADKALALGDAGAGESLVDQGVEAATETPEIVADAVTGAIPEQLDAAAIAKLKAMIAEFDKNPASASQ
jgi:hypothetical protein